MDGKLGECLSIKTDLAVFHAFDEARVAHALFPHGGIKTRNPERSECALFLAAVDVRMLPRFHHGFIGFLETPLAHATETLGELADFLVPTMSDNAAFYTHDNRRDK